MPRYKVNGSDQTFRRKHTYMPCVLGPAFDAAPPEEQIRLLKETWWADNITGKEWELILGKDCSPVVKSRLKRKMIGWWMALGRIILFAPEVYDQSVTEAKVLYRKQIQIAHPCFRQGDE
jgi:hypothetical protein